MFASSFCAEAGQLDSSCRCHEHQLRRPPRPRAAAATGRQGLRPGTATTRASSRNRPSAPDSSHAAQVARLGAAIGGMARAQARGVERGDTVSCGQRVDRERSIGRAVEARRMIERRTIAVVGLERLCRRGRRSEHAKAIENARRRYGLGGRFARGTGTRSLGVARYIDDASEHFHECTRNRQIRPACVGADMEEGDHTLAALLAGHERRAVAPASPSSWPSATRPAPPAPAG